MCFAQGGVRLNVDKTMYGTLDAERVPASTKFVGSYMDHSEEVSARVAAANKAFYKMKTVMRQDSGVSKTEAETVRRSRKAYTDVQLVDSTTQEGTARQTKQNAPSPPAT